MLHHPIFHHSSFAYRINQRIQETDQLRVAVMEPYGGDPVLDSRRDTDRLHIHPKTLQRVPRRTRYTRTVEVATIP